MSVTGVQVRILTGQAVTASGTADLPSVSMSAAAAATSGQPNLTRPSLAAVGAQLVVGSGTLAIGTVVGGQVGPDIVTGTLQVAGGGTRRRHHRMRPPEQPPAEAEPEEPPDEEPWTRPPAAWRPSVVPAAHMTADAGPTLIDLLQHGWPAEYRHFFETGDSPALPVPSRAAHMTAAAGGPARDGATGAVAGRVPLRPSGHPLPPGQPQVTALDRWTMLHLWSRAVPAQYAALLRAPILPDHPGRTTVPASVPDHATPGGKS